MSTKRLTALLLTLLLLPTELPGAELSLKWSQLSPVVTGKKVTLTVSGTEQTGKVQELRPDAIELDKNRVIRRAEITNFVLHTKVKKNRITTVSIGAGIIVTSAIIAANTQGFEAVFIALFGGIAGLATIGVGYFIANNADRRRTTITILPD
jgi:hypothetical protein